MSFSFFTAPRAFVGAAALALAALVAAPAAATPLTITDPGIQEDTGTFGIGLNTVTWTSSGSCRDFRGDPSDPFFECSGGDVEFFATLAVGTVLESVTITSTATSGPSGIGSRFTGTGSVSFFERYGLGATLVVPIGPVVGDGTATAYEGFTEIADAGGTYSFSQTVSFLVSEVVVDVAPVPLPASAVLLLAGIGGLGVMSRRRKRTA